jgi:hypothetical protein
MSSYVKGAELAFMPQNATRSFCAHRATSSLPDCLRMVKATIILVVVGVVGVMDI